MYNIRVAKWTNKLLVNCMLYTCIVTDYYYFRFKLNIEEIFSTHCICLIKTHPEHNNALKHVFMIKCREPLPIRIRISDHFSASQ